ncbi:MAG: zinc ribbon domain-containing protein [Pirellulales bacterium]|nr:zinc ribbon domain-containing protein [Pirellulales bacterium]
MIGWFITGLALSAVIGGLIGRLKGQQPAGVVLGFLLGPLGWLITLLLNDNRPRCPACRGVIDPQASICQHCRISLAQAPKSRTSEEEPFCVKCGVDGIKSYEFGQLVAVCPKCGRRL